LEVALLLKEISYVQAGALPTGELKHGPFAISDCKTAVVTMAPNDALRQAFLRSFIKRIEIDRGKAAVHYYLSLPNN
jgi:glucosamine 6-phosphate synthetase-like amidotransferase/phosphosugar isomerase protein